MGLGRVIRDAGFSTDVGQETAEPLASAPGVCFSACAFAYAGGGWRYLDEESKIGVHRVYREVARADDLAAGQSVSGVITRYLSDMGVSTELFARMAQIPSEDLHVLAPEEARRLRLVNDGRGVPEWSIEASDAGFYLRGAQDTDSGPGKVVLGCVGTGWVLMGFYSVTNAEEIAAGAVRASIRVDDAFVRPKAKTFYAKNGDVVGTADLATGHGGSAQASFGNRVRVSSAESERSSGGSRWRSASSERKWNGISVRVRPSDGVVVRWPVIGRNETFDGPRS